MYHGNLGPFIITDQLKSNFKVADHLGAFVWKFLF